MAQPNYAERFEKQNPYAQVAADKAETLPEVAAIYARLAVAFQIWRSGGHD